MNILIVSATDKEITPLIEHLIKGDGKQKELKKYFYKKHAIDILTTGVGMIATTYWLTKTLSHRKYDIVLNVGIAGSFEKKIKIGTTLNVEYDRFSEMGAEDDTSFLSLSDLALLDKNEFPFKKEQLKSNYKGKNKVINDLKKVKGITVNRVHGNEKNIAQTKKIFSPQVESMEGAACMYVCLIEKQTCIQIRAISNYIEKRNRKNWNIPTAIKNLNLKVLEIINHF